LGSATLNDVHARHDLEAADQTRVQVQGERLCLNQVAINSITNAQDVIEGFDVNVRCSVAKALADERGDHLNHGAVIIVM
jgi:C4-dicarboxylate-specific signal transduction histidine kinase